MLSGGQAPALRYATIGDALAAVHGAAGVVLVDGEERERRVPWSELHTRARHVAGALVSLGVRPGDSVVIVLPTGPDFLDAFFGATLAGAVPVPLYPPVRLGRIDEYHASTARMITAVKGRIVLTDARVGRLLGVALERSSPPLGLHHVASLADGRPIAPVERRASDLALIQFSSGSTVDPKPVALTHANILSQCAMVSATLPDEGEACGVSWLPLYHDMGLIGGLLTALYHRGTMVLIAPEQFLAKPATWLRAISRHRAMISPAPNFAFAVATKRIKAEDLAGVDLSCWRFALCGAEPVSAKVMQEFARRFAPHGFDPRALMPVYGLAEASLAVTFTRSDAPVRAVHRGSREIVSVGAPVPGVDVMLKNDDGEEDQVGRIYVRGPAVMAGYFDRPDATKEALVDGWLDTGDLGFTHEGELYVTGRAKDVIVIRGRNHAPQEFEDGLDDLPGVRPGCAIAVGHVGDDGEELLLLVERARETSIDAEALERQIKDAIVARTGVRAQRVVLLDPGTLPRTSSGKLRRQEALRRYTLGALDAPRAVSGLFIAKELVRSTVAKIRMDLGSMFDVAIVGGGPAGLAVAIGAAKQGLSAVVLERSRTLPDKACGEGVMPPGIRALERLGVMAHVRTSSRIDGIRYLQDEGPSVEGRLPGEGRSIRRLALIEAFAARAREIGVDLRLHAGVRRHAINADHAVIETDTDRIEARVLVAADGLASPIRHAAGLDRPPRGSRRRYGLRRHFACAPWTSFVEVHLADSCEAYLTPHEGQVGVAFLWEDGKVEPKWSSFLRLFPRVARHLEGAQPLSEARGAGPLLRTAHRISSPRLALAGDAAGYVDAITGEGLSISLVAAEALTTCLPAAMRGDPAAFDPYARAFDRVFDKYRWSTEALLFFSRRPWLRRPLVGFLARNPRVFESALGWVVG